jgi:hypothetical protein
MKDWHLLENQVSNRCAALEDLDTEVETDSTWETIKENIKISVQDSLGYCELEKHKHSTNDKIKEPATNSKNKNIRDLYRSSILIFSVKGSVLVLN